jgi:hypothetical protein
MIPFLQAVQRLAPFRRMIKPAAPEVVSFSAWRGHSLLSGSLNIHSKVSDGSKEPGENLRSTAKRGFDDVSNAAHNILKASGKAISLPAHPGRGTQSGISGDYSENSGRWPPGGVR